MLLTSGSLGLSPKRTEAGPLIGAKSPMLNVVRTRMFLQLE
jgi:hypothetical protein